MTFSAVLCAFENCWERLNHELLRGFSPSHNYLCPSRKKKRREISEREEGSGRREKGGRFLQR